MTYQRCAGCGVEAESHPIVGIAQPTAELKPYELPLAPSPRGFVAYAVCGTCHTDPAHRRRVLKAAFFPQSQVTVALREAGSNSVRQA